MKEKPKMLVQKCSAGLGKASLKVSLPSPGLQPIGGSRCGRTTARHFPAAAPTAVLCHAPCYDSHLINRWPSLCYDLSSLLWLGIRGMAMLMVSVAAAV